MAGDLPDYTEYIVPNVSYPELIRPFGTKAETVDHKHAEDSGVGGVELTLPAPADGYKIGLIMIIACTETAGSKFFLHAKQSGAWRVLMTDIHLDADDPMVLVFPCWIPTQDTGDGSTETITMQIDSACADRCSVFCLYFEELA